MRKLFMVSALAAVFLVTACSDSKKDSRKQGGDLKGRISISGAFALYPMTVKWSEEFRKLYPAIQIDISAGGAGKGMADALSGMVDLGMFSRNVSEEEKARGAWYIALTRDAVVPTINAHNPFLDDLMEKGVTREKLLRLFVTGEVTTWEELLDLPPSSEITLFTRSDACGAAATWAAFLGVNQEDLLGLGVFGDPGVADAVKNDLLGFGYNNVAYVYDINSRKKYENLEILPLDLNMDGSISEDEQFYDSLDSLVQAIQEGLYPAPPARDLYFVAHGRPEKEEVILFIDWILTKGQEFLEEGGYVSLPEEQIKKELEKLHP
jgi:phosphate transport system substrate-binding protein